MLERAREPNPHSLGTAGSRLFLSPFDFQAFEFFTKAKQSRTINPDKIINKIKASRDSRLKLNGGFSLRALAHFLHSSKVTIR